MLCAISRRRREVALADSCVEGCSQRLRLAAVTCLASSLLWRSCAARSTRPVKRRNLSSRARSINGRYLSRFFRTERLWAAAFTLLCATRATCLARFSEIAAERRPRPSIALLARAWLQARPLSTTLRKCWPARERRSSKAASRRCPASSMRLSMAKRRSSKANARLRGVGGCRPPAAFARLAAKTSSRRLAAPSTRSTKR
mmetsp:Transcript_22964/g.66478  ORF Transcript_22964/g.66478 Transcript_22964/m.66478 type:complete len:201 (-) Transcript_22964:740-1342(-)